MAFDQDGIKALKPKAIGGRQRENMTVAAEKALLERFAHAAGASELLNIRPLSRTSSADCPGQHALRACQKPNSTPFSG
jgi:hypothetical protein